MTRWTEEQLADFKKRVPALQKAAAERVPRKLINPVKKRSKYGNTREKMDGITFDSKGEARRYGELKVLVAARQITDLKVHTRWPLHVAGPNTVVGHYESDFDYHRYPSREFVVEDFKGMSTSFYRWKKKHFEAEYGMKITEVTK